MTAKIGLYLFKKTLRMLVFYPYFTKKEIKFQVNLSKIAQ